jgi:DNA-binding GntR family transcriptional regulator
MYGLDGVSLDPKSPVPLYHQAAQALEEAVLDQRLRSASKLPNEVDLARQLGISRPTMRAAIQELVNKGLVVRRRGVGTMIARAPLTRPSALTSLYDDLKKSGNTPKTKVLAFNAVQSSPEAETFLRIDSDTSALTFDRLRLADSTPVALMHNAIRADLLEIKSEDLDHHGLYELFRRNGITPHSATQKVGAAKADAKEAKLLKIKQGDPLLTAVRFTYDVKGNPIEYGSHRYPAESYTFETVLLAR